MIGKIIQKQKILHSNILKAYKFSINYKVNFLSINKVVYNLVVKNYYQVISGFKLFDHDKLVATLIFI